MFGIFYRIKIYNECLSTSAIDNIQNKILKQYYFQIKKTKKPDESGFLKQS